MRNVAWKTVFLGLIASASACSSASNGSGSSPASANRVGSVGLELTLPAGLVINQVAYTLGGPSSYAGTIDVSDSSTIEVGVGNVATGSGYVLSETAATDDGTVVCSGSSAPFSVSAGQTTAVNVALACTTSPEAGAVVGTSVATECATWTSAFATPNETTVGGIAQISASATAPDLSAVTFTWSPSAGTIDTPNQASANFTCPATPGAVTLTLTVGDGPIPSGGACPLSDTTTTITVTCDPIAIDAGPVDSGAAADTGSDTTADSGVDAGSPDAAPPPPPVPCTAAGQTGCVACSGNTDGVCSPSEALFVQQDINAGSAATTPCYSCLLNAGCIDDSVFGDQGNECGDLAGTFNAGAQAGTASSALCLDTLACVLSTGCASSAASTCFCGSSEGSACLSVPMPDGACYTQEVNGLGLSANEAILESFTNVTLPSGVANQLAQCALSNQCNSCLQ
jgi:hypothetical protein